MYRRLYQFLIALLLLPPVWLSSMKSTAFAGGDKVELDPALTQIDFLVPGTLHTTRGSFALKNGTVNVDSETGNASGQIVIDSASENSLEALRDAIMKDGILDVDHYPEITFVPERVEGVRDQSNHFYGLISGLMWLHGSAHEMKIEVHGHVDGNQLTAACQFLVPYVDWGVESPNVLTSRQIISATRHYNVGSGTFSTFAYLLPFLRKIPPNLFGVSDLIQVNVKTTGRIIWASATDARNITVIAPPR